MLPKEERKQDEKTTAYCLKKKETWSNGNSILPKEERNKIKRQQHTLLPEEERNKIKRQQHTAWRRKKQDQTATAYCLKKKEKQDEKATAYCLKKKKTRSNSNSILPLIYWISHLRSVFRIQKYSGPDPEICPGSRNLPLFGSGYCLIVSGSGSGPFHPVAFEVWRKNYTGYF